MDAISAKFCVHLVSILLYNISFIFFRAIPKKCVNFTDTEADGDAYLGRHREIIPAVYNLAMADGRTTHGTRLLTVTEYNNALNSGLVAMSNRFEVKQEKLFDEISDLRKRCVGTIDGLDDSDIEELRDIIDDSDDSDDGIVELAIQPTAAQSIDNGNANNLISIEQSHGVVDDANGACTSQNVQTNNSSIGNVSSSEPEAQQNDEDIDIAALSGTMIVHQTEVHDLIYPEYDASIRFAIAKMLISWNRTYPFSASVNDKRFIGVLYRGVIGYQPNQNQLKGVDFMKKLFAIRSQNDVERVDSFEDLFQIIHEKAKKKSAK